MHSASTAQAQETKPVSEMCTVLEQSTLRTKIKREGGPGNIAPFNNVVHESLTEKSVAVEVSAWLKCVPLKLSRVLSASSVRPRPFDFHSPK